jgi:hypothetical protein
LRIASSASYGDLIGDAVDAVDAEAATTAGKGAEPDQKEAVGKVDQSAVLSFTSELLTRLSKENPGKTALAAVLADSLAALAEVVKEKFGQEKSNEFMSLVMGATDAGVSEKGLANAVTGSFGQIIREAGGDPDALAKLSDMIEFLNAGLEKTLAGAGEADALEVAGGFGLSHSLNLFFGTEAVLSDDGLSAVTKGFDSFFQRTELTVGEDSQDGYFYVRVGANVKPGDVDPGREAADSLASYLREVVGNEGAAAYLEEGAAADFLGTVAVAVAVVARENGQDAARDLVAYLNANVADLVGGKAGISLEGWGLSRDYADPEARVSGTPTGKLMLMSLPSEEELLRTKHQYMSTNWRDTNGVDSEVTVDLTDLYAGYVGSQAAGSASAPMKRAVGNLVDSIV